MVVGGPAWGVALTLGCARSATAGDPTSTGRSGGEARPGPDARPADAAAIGRNAGARDGVDAGAPAKTVRPPAPPPAPTDTPAKRERWPKPAQVTGTREQLEGLPRMPGIQVHDHGQQRVHPDRWRIHVDIIDARAAAALRARGVEIKLGEYPTADELRKDAGLDPPPARAKRRH